MISLLLYSIYHLENSFSNLNHPIYLQYQSKQLAIKKIELLDELKSLLKHPITPVKLSLSSTSKLSQINEKVNDEYYKITIADFSNNEIILSAGKKRYIKIIID